MIAAIQALVTLALLAAAVKGIVTSLIQIKNDYYKQFK